MKRGVFRLARQLALIMLSPLARQPAKLRLCSVFDTFFIFSPKSSLEETHFWPSAPYQPLFFSGVAPFEQPWDRDRVFSGKTPVKAALSRRNAFQLASSSVAALSYSHSAAPRILYLMKTSTGSFGCLRYLPEYA